MITHIKDADRQPARLQIIVARTMVA